MRRLHRSRIVLSQPITNLPQNVQTLLLENRKMRGTGYLTIRSFTPGRQNLKEFKPLIYRNAFVTSSMENQQGWVMSSRKPQKKSAEGLWIVVRPPLVVISLNNIACPNEAVPIGDTCAFDGRPITVSLGQGPCCNEAACAPAKDAQALGVGPSRVTAKSVALSTSWNAIGAIAAMLVNRFHERQIGSF